MDLPPKVMDQPLPRPTVFTNTSSTTSTAAVWQSGEQWRCVKMTDQTLSVQQLEASALVLACGLFTEEHLNIVTDSMFVAKLCLAMARTGTPGVAVVPGLAGASSTKATTTGTMSLIHVNSHNPIKGLGYQTGNDKADATAKGLWTLREAQLQWPQRGGDTQQLHDTLHIGAKAIAKQCRVPISDARHIVATCPHCQK
ncbi:POL1 protein, partial [Sterrhoptilus dennistouni]|nr:POL1 protein [Sterrhoptilus dennistouni]